MQCIASVLRQDPTPGLVVVDNASADGTADSIADQWPALDLEHSGSNLGFGAAANLGAQGRASDWILLLNPDAEPEDGAISRLVTFAKSNPGHGIYGGRTTDALDQTVEDCCQARITPWSVFCLSVGLTRAFRSWPLFNPEWMPGWARDSVCEVDAVFGAFCLIERGTWDALGGFDPIYWLYGEDLDLCYRSTRLNGKRPLFTPDATARHVGGAASEDDAAYRMRIAKGRITVMRQHWPWIWRPLIRPLHLVWVGTRAAAEGVARMVKRLRGRPAENEGLWRVLWRTRSEWLGGYGP